jgi:hypothetical protein
VSNLEKEGRYFKYGPAQPGYKRHPGINFLRRIFLFKPFFFVFDKLYEIAGSLPKLKFMIYKYSLLNMFLLFLFFTVGFLM